MTRLRAAGEHVKKGRNINAPPTMNAQAPARNIQAAPVPMSRHVVRPSPKYSHPPSYYQQQFQQRPPPPPSKKRKRSRGIGRWISLLTIGILLLYLMANQDMVMGLLQPGAKYVEYPTSAEFIVEREIEFSGNSIGFQIGIPEADHIETMAGTYLQKIHSLDETHDAEIQYELIDETSYFNDRLSKTDPPSSSNPKMWMHWSLPSGNDGRFVIKTRYHVTSKIAVWDLNEDRTGTVKDIAGSSATRVVGIRDKYLVDEWLIRPSDPTIQDIAGKISEGTGGDAYLIIKNAYMFMDSNFQYQTVGGMPKDCVATLESRTGDCDDQSILLASILRAAGIPAWLELGILYDSVANQWGGHAWLKVWMPMNSGGQFDPDASGTVDIDVVNDEFLFRDPYRFAEWESDGNGDHLETYYTFAYGISGTYNFDVNWNLISLNKSAETERYILSGEEAQSIPGFDPSFALMAIVAAFTMMSISRRKDDDGC